FFFSSRRRHTSSKRDWSSDVCSSDLAGVARGGRRAAARWARCWPVGASEPVSMSFGCFLIRQEIRSSTIVAEIARLCRHSSPGCGLGRSSSTVSGPGGGTAVLAGLVSAYHEVMGENSGLSHDEQYSTALTVGDVRGNVAEVDDRIAAAASRAGRDRAEIELLPVSKTVPQERIRLAVAAGCHKLGENKVQEAHRKSEEMADLDIDWSVIGHLQSNKAKDVARFASEFQALDRIKVARALDRRLQGEGRSLDVYVQVNTSAEDSKFGMPPEELLGFLRDIREFDTLKFQGLMTLAIFSSDIERVRPCFRMLAELRERARQTDPDLIGAGRLSMGMSGDFEV